jgi:hypothetical protein
MCTLNFEEKHGTLMSIAGSSNGTHQTPLFRISNGTLMSIAGSSNGTHQTPLFRISNRYNLGLKLSFVTRKKGATGGEGPTAKQDYECLIKIVQGNQKNFDREQKMLVEFHVTLQGFENWFIEQNNTYISNTF